MKMPTTNAPQGVEVMSNTLFHLMISPEALLLLGT